MWSRFIRGTSSLPKPKANFFVTQSEAHLPANKRKVLYRSKQTGFLELDLILGNWAEKNLPKMTEQQVEEYEKLISCEVPELYKWLSGQENPPKNVDGKLFRQIKESVFSGTAT
eukprot:ctg_1669.g650